MIFHMIHMISVKRVMRSLGLAALAVLVGLVAFGDSAHGQNSGTVGLLAQLSPVFSAQTATKCSGILPDIGQGSNVLFIVQTSSGGGTAIIDLEWSPTGSAPFYPITQASYNDIATASHQLSTNGYFPNMRSCLTYTGGTWSAWYSASSGPVGPATGSLGTGGLTSPVTCDQSTEVQAATSTTGLAGPAPINSGDTIVVCSMTGSFNGATSAGSLNFQWGGSSCGSLVGAYLAYTTSGTPQSYPIPTQLRSYSGVGGVRNYLCLNNTSGATASVLISWASVHSL